MIDETTRKTAVIIDGRLSCSVKGKTNDLFGDDDKVPSALQAKIDALEAKIETLRKERQTLREQNILESFRSECRDFIRITSNTPTLVLMNYRDLDLLCDAYNKEKHELGCERESIQTYSSYVNRRFVDGVKIKTGCDQEPGQLRFYSAEGC